VGDAVDEIMRLRVLANVLNKDNRKLETENKDLLKEVGAATALLNNVTAEMSNARVEIREMNRRIDMLRGRKS
jgi:predicted  nucleic acid-binding Zn-ribbon protein